MKIGDIPAAALGYTTRDVANMAALLDQGRPVIEAAEAYEAYVSNPFPPPDSPFALLDEILVTVRAMQAARRKSDATIIY